jgi:hypothetical protein
MIPAADVLRVLDGIRGDDAQRVAAVRVDRLRVGDDAGAAAGIMPGEAQHQRFVGAHGVESNRRGRPARLRVLMHNERCRAAADRIAARFSGKNPARNT